MSALEKENTLGARITAEPRTDWTRPEVAALFELPFNDLLYSAQWVHRQNFDANAVQISTLLSIKTGACPEDCAYCPQSSHYDTGLDSLVSRDASRTIILVYLSGSQSERVATFLRLEPVPQAGQLSTKRFFRSP